MFELFLHPSRDIGGIYTWPQFDYIRRTYQRELEKIEEYYHSRVYAVKSNHFLVNLLNVLNVPMQYTPERFVQACRARGAYAGKTLGMTSELSPGLIHHGTFYGPGSEEILLAVDDWFDLSDVISDWQNVSAVKVRWHSRSDLGLMLPNGKASGTETGLATIEINIAQLALQYRQFSIDQYKRQSETGGMLGGVHFIHMYVLPNMMRSHMDIVVMNRLMNLYYGKPMGASLFHHAFSLSDYAGKMDVVLKQVLARLGSVLLSDEAMLGNIPTVVHSTMQNALQMPDLAPTKQVWWALLLSRLEVMTFLVDLNVSTGSLSRNHLDLNALSWDLQRLKRENILRYVLPRRLYDETMDSIDHILQISP